MSLDAGSRILAVPVLGERSGGVGQVSLLLRRTLERAWPGESSVVTLLPDDRLSPTMSDKLAFGWTMHHRQVRGRARWILFAHLGLARVDRWVPSAVRAPYAVFLHGVEAWDRLAAPDLAVLRGARLRVANSAFTARRAAAANPGIGPIDVCPLALVDEPDVPPGDAIGRQVLVVGRMSSGERYKGHDELIAAWPAVIAAEPEAELVFVGDGDDRPRLETLARGSPVASRIRFTGFVERGELEAYYRRAAIFALPSRNEGFGLVYLEAMAHYLPCIGSTRDAAGEVVADRETGLLVDEHPESIARAVTTLLGDSGLRQRMGRAGHARWRQSFSRDRFETRMTALLEDAFESERRAS